ncbi:hypothetical protein DUNSADRAFT_10842 [Dunaliella salina]|uniref:PDZ domain-containing protein n=1 Tax=Dunaliella salina TaxID=3046 RepID=A0ABQ7H9Y7_DUNSA|nr:hypothetical protein DUNSADRAFT_10842 [Dunaliella salina]|eukprot:KAF5843667.1 hypothetical protein DUNSADRAFT_10842 [Dunaliella salina]
MVMMNHPSMLRQMNSMQQTWQKPKLLPNTLCSARPGLACRCKAAKDSADNNVTQVDLGDAGIVRLPLPAGTLHVVKLPFPLGLVLEETDPGTPTVLSVENGGNAQNADVQVGDILVCCSAASREMAFPAWQLALGGGGTPTVRRVPVLTAGRPFPQVSAAIKSNQDLADPRVDLVFKRKELEASQVVEDRSGGKINKDGGSVFSPQLFE